VGRDRSVSSQPQGERFPQTNSVFLGAVRFVQVHLRLGIALRCLGRPDDALKEFYCAVRLAPNDPEAHYHLGMALKGQDDFDGATAAFRLAVALKPDFEKAVTI
jgi:Flp pilus assembly protein TadD